MTVPVGRAVDWRFAAAVGGWLARPGPPMTDYTRRRVIDDLSRAARAAEPLVRQVTGLGVNAPVADARIVDRAEWITAAAASMRAMIGGTEESDSPIAGRITGAHTGALLAFVSTGILGQYDPFSPGPDSGGLLLLVYPNVIAVERQLQLPPDDFRLWVCLHEVTHRVQFTVHPWLADHMSQALATLTSQAQMDLLAVAGRLANHLRGRDDPGSPAGILGVIRAVQAEPQRAALDQLMVLGTLLEGHAEHVMDAVGPAAVPSVATIRRRFDERRRRSQPPLQRLLRALLGVDAKLRQYTRGRNFVDHVVGAVGMDRFNTVWTGPHTLPLPAEIEEPQRWITRVL